MFFSAKKHCVVVTCFDESQPGFLDFSYRIAALAKVYQLTIISQFRITQAELEFVNVDYQVFKIKNGKLGWFSYVLKCAKFIRKHKPAVLVLLHSAAAPIALLTGSTPVCLYWNEHPSNLVRSPTSFAPFSYAMAVILQRIVFIAAKKADLVMPIGEAHLVDLHKNGIQPSNTKMLYMGVSKDFIPTDDIHLGNCSQVLRLIYTGTVSKARGRDVMLEAMALLDKENIDVHLTIIGCSDDQLKFCTQRVNELGIEKSVELLGRIPGKNIPDYLAQADLGICLWERSPWTEFNPPTKLFEYLVAGLPILASNISSHTRYVDNWKNGLIFEYDANSLAEIIINLNLQKSKIIGLKERAKDSGKQYLWEKLEPIFLKEVHQLVVA